MQEGPVSAVIDCAVNEKVLHVSNREVQQLFDGQQVWGDMAVIGAASSANNLLPLISTGR